MAIMVRELALLKGEVPNAASWPLVSWQYQNGAGRRASARWPVRSERASSPNTSQQPRPPTADISPPFLAYPALGHISFICIESLAPTSTARDTFVDALHRSGFPGKETRYTCARVKESDRIRHSDDRVTSPYILFHRTTIARPTCHQVLYSLVRLSTFRCANE